MPGHVYYKRIRFLPDFFPGSILVLAFPTLFWNLPAMKAHLHAGPTDRPCPAKSRSRGTKQRGGVPPEKLAFRGHVSTACGPNSRTAREAARPPSYISNLWDNWGGSPPSATEFLVENDFGNTPSAIDK